MPISLTALGVHFLSGSTTVGGVPVGGLSGIDFDPDSGRWVLASDSREQRIPVHAFDAAIDVGEGGFGSVAVAEAIVFRQADGSPYPTIDQPGVTPDIESIRIDPANGHLWVVLEGVQSLGAPPELIEHDRDGAFVRSFPLPERFHFAEDERSGPRPNRAAEGMTFAADGATVWVAMEGPLIQDGDGPTVDAGAPVRLVQLDRTGNQLREVVYEVDPLARSSDGEAIGGVSEILAIDDERLLVLERQSAPRLFGIPDFTVRLYEATLTGATDVREVDALPGASWTPVPKRLLLDLGKAGIGMVTNVEGICWGPRLANGHRSLVLIADNNDVRLLPSQLLALDAGER